ncbi:MAG: AtpZ/AtpI family protein [Chloroflexi bacterium]|nr:AtpZ/AtpI family protein [Chloroflexota bacterium]MBU1746053.1 AtpZ/AtpI family protein [Chloroflexota bacterium]
MTKNKRERASWGALWREALRATTLGWDLVLPIFIGTLVGYFLDQWLGTGHIFTMGLLVLGIGVGYYNVVRFIRQLNERDRERKAREQSEAEE